MVLTEIDQMELTLHEEYNKLFEKDKDENKDLNMKALEQLKL